MIRSPTIKITDVTKPDLKAVYECKRSPLQTVNLTGFNPVVGDDINSQTLAKPCMEVLKSTATKILLMQKPQRPSVWKDKEYDEATLPEKCSKKHESNEGSVSKQKEGDKLLAMNIFLIVLLGVVPCYLCLEFKDGDILLEDMILTQNQYKWLLNSTDRSGSDPYKPWPRATIYYKFYGKFEDIMKALKKIMKVSCLKFVDGYASYGLGQHLKIRKDDKRCYSGVGFRGTLFPMSIFLGKCDEGGIIHEFLHIAGLKHEHNTQIRDNHIKINWKNVMLNKIMNLDKYTIDTTFGLPYDFDSIMHYHSYVFSKNRYPTIIRKNNKKRYITRNKKMKLFMVFKYDRERLKCYFSS
uniref:Metalloendopeptidase n=1 Tax=Megaselia scalaris TaxID=36166 RepID=T1GGU4_MEGSC